MSNLFNDGNEFFKSVQMNEAGQLIKSKEMPIGTVSKGRKKIAKGKWVLVKKVNTQTQDVLQPGTYKLKNDLKTMSLSHQGDVSYKTWKAGDKIKITHSAGRDTQWLITNKTTGQVEHVKYEDIEKAVGQK